MSCRDGEFGPARAPFLAATITTAWKPKGYDSPQIIVSSIHDFLVQTLEGACSEPVFEEKMVTTDVKIRGGIAQAWAQYRARFGKHGFIKQWGGTDAFTLLKHDGHWKIVSLVFLADTE